MESFFNNGYGVAVASASGLVAAIGWSSLMSALISILTVTYLSVSVVLRFREFIKRIHEDWEVHKEHVRNRVRDHQEEIQKSCKE
jgi:hypothetical protein